MANRSTVESEIAQRPAYTAARTRYDAGRLNTLHPVKLNENNVQHRTKLHHLAHARRQTLSPSLPKSQKLLPAISLHTRLNDASTTQRLPASTKLKVEEFMCVRCICSGGMNFEYNMRQRWDLEEILGMHLRVMMSSMKSPSSQHVS